MKAKEENDSFMRQAISLANKGMHSNEGGPFGAIIVKNGKVVGVGNNRVTSTNDPTAHAEVVAIRDACKNLGTFQLDGCILYTSCEPCPMCLGAIYWARPSEVFFGCTKEDAAKIGFDDKLIYSELKVDREHRKIKMTQILQAEAQKVFDEWDQKHDKIKY